MTSLKLLLGLCLGLLMVFPPAASASEVLRPVGDVPLAGIGRAGKVYFQVEYETVIVPLQGPGKITGYVRAVLFGDPPQPASSTVEITGIPLIDPTHTFDFAPSRSGRWTEERPGVPSGGQQFVIEVPSGRHEMKLSAPFVEEGGLWVILYWEGPPQPDIPGLEPLVLATPTTAPAAKESPKRPWDFRGTASLDMIYNDNILTDSAGYNDDFISGSYPWKFAIESNDDVVMAPAIDLQARKHLFPIGQSRFRLKIKHWQYMNNPIKANTDFNFYIRQYFGKKTSLELYLHAAPEQYIRQLSDRSPLADPDSPIAWEEFRFQRNIWNLTLRRKATNKLNLLLLYEENYRYYNQPFMENDIEAWEIRANASYKISRTFTVSLDYSYEDAQGRAIDEVDETPETSDNSDASYERDLYRVGLTIRPKPFKRVLDRIDLSFLFMDYYYTTQRDLADDPYHVGRNDRYYKGTVDVRRKISKPMTLRLAVRRTERTVSSPWEGDITTDKDFTQWLYWVSLSYQF